MDVDIDLSDRNQLLKCLDHVPASMFRDGDLVRHNSGIYFQNIPFNPVTGAASIDYKTAQERGYFKIDLLNVSVYEDVRDEQHLIDLMNTTPAWDRLYEKAICDQLPHVNGYHLLLQRLRPQSVEQLAMFLALIRPGKKWLTPRVEQQGWDSIRQEIWTRTGTTEYEFKRSHSIAYAMMVIVKLNLVCENNV